MLSRTTRRFKTVNFCIEVQANSYVLRMESPIHLKIWRLSWKKLVAWRLENLFRIYILLSHNSRISKQVSTRNENSSGGSQYLGCMSQHLFVDGCWIFSVVTNKKNFKANKKIVKFCEKVKKEKLNKFRERSEFHLKVRKFSDRKPKTQVVDVERDFCDTDTRFRSSHFNKFSYIVESCEKDWETLCKFNATQTRSVMRNKSGAYDAAIVNISTALEHDKMRH